MSQRSTLLALLVVGSISAPAAADPLAEADAAYGKIEFGETQRLARSALTSGGYDRAQLVRIYFLLGVSAAADGKDDEAIDAFKHLLAIDPDTKVDRGLSPKLQGPMLEARGTPPAPLSCEASFDRSRGVLHFTIRDQLAMSRALVVRWRLAGAFTEVRAPSNAGVDVTLPGAAGAERLEYFYQLVDDHQNRVFEKGSDAAPEVAQLAVVAPQTQAPAPRHKLATKWLAIGIVGELLGVAGIAGGIGAYFVGKDAADRWNNDSICLAGGMSRNTNCSGDKSTASAAESGSIAAFALGGAFIAASTILLIAAPREREQSMASLGCGAGPGMVGIACGGRF